MFMRSMLVVLVSLAGATGTVLAEDAASERPLGVVELRLTGKLASEYLKLGHGLDDRLAADEIQVSTTGRVAQQLDDGRIRIEHSAPIIKDGVQSRMVTLTATVDAAAIQTRTIPKGTATFSSPIAKPKEEKPRLTEKATKHFVVNLKDFKGVKLRSWNLASEVGE